MGDGLNGNGGRLRVRVTCTECHQIMSSGGMRWILNRAKKFSGRGDRRMEARVNVAVLKRDNWKCST